MTDLTVIFLTVNEVPESWAKYHREVLLEAIGDADLITISKKPLDFGVNILQNEPRSLSNIYWQLLRGAKMATTDYIAVAEDDTLYPPEHFLHRPKTFAYNTSHWSLFTWGIPTYHWRNRFGNYTLIAPRKLVIEALEERFSKWPNGTPDNRTGELGRTMVEHNLKTTHYPVEEFYTSIAVVNFNHDMGSDNLVRSRRKRMGMLRCYDIPHWGRAEDLVTKFK